MAQLYLCARLQCKTALMYAIEAKLEGLAEKLIEKGADIDAKDVCSAPLLPAGLPQLCPELLTDWCVGCATRQHPQIAGSVVDVMALLVL